MDGDYSDEFVAWARGVKTSKRAQAALEILLARGSVTTGDLQAVGYDHPPRAVRDLKDAGFVIEMKMVTVDGKRMSRYTLVDTMSGDGRAIRKPIPTPFRKALFEAHGHRCSACRGKFITRMLQADHRVPFEIGGDADEFRIKDFMPLCGSDNRSKSMSCETCPNWTVRDVSFCQTCYWHDPDNYEHLAGVEERRINLVFQGSDADTVRRLADKAAAQGQSLEAYVRGILEREALL